MSIITKITASNDLKAELKSLIKPLIGNISDLIKPTDRVLLKPNFNTSDPYPASTDVNFLQAVIELLNEAQPKEIIVGDSCTYFLKTEKVCNEIGAPTIMDKFNVTWHNFDNHKWLSVPVPNGQYFKKIKIPHITQEVDKIIFLPCLKTHRFARFTMSLKISIGLLKPSQRGVLHLNHLEERVSEVASVFKPDLIILDGRKCFVTLGPEKGQVEQSNILMAGTDRIALDIEALKILMSYQADNLLGNDPWALKQITTAIKLGLGAKNETEYQLINL